MAELTHIDTGGSVRMVDVSGKPATDRRAVAGGTVRMRPETLEMILTGKAAKGNALETARIAGMMAAKRTADLIPMCHPLNLAHVAVDFEPDRENACIHIRAAARIMHHTGVEMEALTAVAVAALTLYDMCKAVDRDMTITNIRLLEKSGGRSGHYARDEANAGGGSTRPAGKNVGAGRPAAGTDGERS